MTVYEGNQVGFTLEVRMCECVVSSLFLSLHMLRVILLDFKIKHSVLSCKPYYQTPSSYN